MSDRNKRKSSATSKGGRKLSLKIATFQQRWDADPVATIKDLETAGFADSDLRVIFGDDLTPNGESIAQKQLATFTKANAQFERFREALRLVLRNPKDCANIILLVSDYGRLREQLGRYSDRFDSLSADQMSNTDRAILSAKTRTKTSPRTKRLLAIESFLHKIKFSGRAPSFLKVHETELRNWFRVEKVVPVSHEQLEKEVREILKLLEKR